MKKLQAIVFLFMLFELSYAQTNYPPNFDGDTEGYDDSYPGYRAPGCEATSTTYQNRYKKPDQYIPNSNTPTKTILLNFNIFRKNNGSGNFQNNAGDNARITQFITWLNNNYYGANNDSPSDPISGINQISDTKILFELNAKYYYDNDNYYNCRNRSSGTYSIRPYVTSFDPNRYNQLNIYLVNGYAIKEITMLNVGSGYSSTNPPVVTISVPGGGGNSAQGTANVNVNGQVTSITLTGQNFGYFTPPTVSIAPPGGGGTQATAVILPEDLGIESGNTWGPYTNIAETSDIFLFNTWNNGSTTYDAAIGNTLAHEIGHALGLLHTYAGNGSANCNAGIEYLNDVFGSPAPGNCPHFAPNPTYPWDYNTFLSQTDRVTNNMMGGFQQGGYFSPKQLGQMHRSLSVFNNRRYVKNCAYSYTDPINITTNETWDFDIKVYNDIVVKTGGTMTLTCKILMPDNARIIVERGGKLIVDGGTITSGCGGMWQGIEVWGTAGASQYTTGMQYNYTQQGYLEIKNGAIIENAKEAIRTVKVNTNGTLDDAYTGGIVIATNSYFRNNRRCAEFRKYDNMYLGSEYNNVSVFRTCSLETTAPLKDPTVVPSEFIRFWDIKGVEVRDNFFKCHTSSGYTGTNRGKGISSLDANYSIDKTTTGPGNRFENLDIGVEQGSGGTVTGTNYVKNNTFFDNTYGMYASGTGTQPYVKDNNFDRAGAAVLSPATYGFFSIGVQGITVACNYFYDFTYGNLVYNTGTSTAPASNINNNQFFYNYKTIQTETNNSKLKLTYNDFTPFASTQTHWYNTGPMSAQGAPGSPAANRFLGSPPPSGDIWNTSSSNLFLYYYNVLTDANTYPDPVSNVMRLTTGITWTPSTWCTSGGGGSLMAGSGSGGGEELLLSGGFEEIQGEQLYGDDAVISEINDFIEAGGLDTNEIAAIEYLEELDNEQADWMLVPYYLGQENYNQAAELIETLNAENLNEATKLNYYRTISNAGLSGRNLSQLDSVEVSSLDVIAASSSDIRDNARSVLHFFYGRNYPTEETSISDVPLYFDEPLQEELIIPNVITPNGDGSNDVFAIENLPEHSSLSIFSNNGTQVYHSDSYRNNWPPTTIPAGRYYYSLILPDGTEQNSYFDVVY